MTDLPGADDDELESTEERLAHEVSGDDRLGHSGGAPGGGGDSAVSLEEGRALAPPD